MTNRNRTASNDAEDEDLRLEIERRIPSTLPAGRGDALFVFGTCFHRRADVESLEVLVDGDGP